MKKCSLCKKEKNKSDFYAQNRRGKKQYQNYCKICSREKVTAYRHNNPIKTMLYDAKRRATKKGWLFDIDESDIFIPEKCPVFGITMERQRGQGGFAKTDNSPSLDRIDPTKGYVRGNVVVVSNKVNLLKSYATVNELELIVNYYKSL